MPGEAKGSGLQGDGDGTGMEKGPIASLVWVWCWAPNLWPQPGLGRVLRVAGVPRGSSLLAHPGRDAIAKTLYALLFGWLTDRINKLVYPRQDALSIAILDIYGFEVGASPAASSFSPSSPRFLRGPVSHGPLFFFCRISTSTASSSCASTMPTSTCSSSSTRSSSRRSRWAGERSWGLPSPDHPRAGDFGVSERPPRGAGLRGRPASQEEYLREQIEWKEIPFSDNQPCIDLISQKPYGILRILDDQSCFPQVSAPLSATGETEARSRRCP